MGYARKFDDEVLYDFELNDNAARIGGIALINQANHAANSTDDVDIPNFAYEMSGTNADLTSTSTAYSRGNGYIVFAPYVDKCNDSSIDGNYWTSATAGSASVTEGGDGVILTGSCGGRATNYTYRGTLPSDGTTGIDLKEADSEIVFYMGGSTIALQSAPPGTVNGTITSLAAVQIVGANAGSINIGSSYSTVTSETTAQDSFDGTFRVTIDVAAEEAKVFLNDATSATSTLDLSTLSGASWYLRPITETERGGGGDKAAKSFARLDFKGISQSVSGAAVTNLTFQSQSQALAETGSTGITSSRVIDNLTSLSTNLSANSGANFGTAFSGRFGIFDDLTAGTDGVMQINGDTPGSLTYPSSALMTLDFWGFQAW